MADADDHQQIGIGRQDILLDTIFLFVMVAHCPEANGGDPVDPRLELDATQECTVILTSVGAELIHHSQGEMAGEAAQFLQE